MNLPPFLAQLERIVLRVVLYALAGVTTYAVVRRLLHPGAVGEDYGPLVLAIGLLVTSAGCVLAARSIGSNGSTPGGPWAVLPGIVMAGLGLVPVVFTMYRPQVSYLATLPPTRRDTVWIATAPPPPDTTAPLAGTPVVADAKPELPPGITAPTYAAPAPRPPQNTASYRAVPAQAEGLSDAEWSLRLQRRVVEGDYEPTPAELARYRRLKDSLQRASALYEAPTAPLSDTLLPQQLASQRYDPFEEPPIEVPGQRGTDGEDGSQPESSQQPSSQTR